MQDKKKKNIKVRDLKPKKDAKGGFSVAGPGHQVAGPGGGHQVAGPGGGHQVTGPHQQK
jgi:hypothetical protein